LILDSRLKLNLILKFPFQATRFHVGERRAFTTGSFALCESVAAAANSGSGKAPSRNGNQPLILPKSRIMTKEPPSR